MPVAATPDAVDRALGRIRLVLGIAVMLVGARAVQQQGSGAAVAAIAGGVAIGASALIERIARPRLGVAVLSGLSVGVDAVVALVVLAALGIEPGDTASLIMVLPLLEAGIRHGLIGMVVTWVGISAAVTGLVVLDDLATAELGEPIQLIALLLLVALPAAHLSEHLCERVGEYARARAVSDRRSAVLAKALDASGSVIAPTPAAVDAALLVALGSLVEGSASLIDTPLPNRFDGGVARVTRGPGATGEPGTTEVSIALLGRPHVLLVCTTTHPVDQFLLDAVELLCAHAEIARYGAALHQSARTDAAEWSRRARQDPLTGALNRAGILEQLDASLMDVRRRVVVAFVDLDDFKQVNDRLGHAAGDAVLRAAHEALRAGFPEARIGRLGGDEFVLVAEEEADSVDDLVERIRGAVSEVDLSASVGVSVREPGQVGSTAVMLDEADGRMYLDKQRRRLPVVGR